MNQIIIDEKLTLNPTTSIIGTKKEKTNNNVDLTEINQMITSLEDKINQLTKEESKIENNLLITRIIIILIVIILVLIIINIL
ncbi:MAG: hypothetical protein Q4Q23_01385 [Methanobacteriaceae archaeon]|nr:hypothetical protein [Methanobacteriaceae archaeon]